MRFMTAIPDWAIVNDDLFRRGLANQTDLTTLPVSSLPERRKYTKVQFQTHLANLPASVNEDREP